MADIKDKIITVESLNALHSYNKSTYGTKKEIDDVENLIYEQIDTLGTTVVPIVYGGTNSSDGATGLANLFASGNTILSSYQYGDELPEAGTAGRIFFKRLTDV